MIFIYISYKNDAIFADANIIAYDETPWAFAAVIMYVAFLIFIVAAVESRTMRGTPFFEVKAAYTPKSEKAAERARKAKFKSAVAFSVAVLLTVFFTVSAFVSKNALMKNGDVVAYGAFGGETVKAKNSDVTEVMLCVEWKKTSNRKSFSGHYELDVILCTEKGSVLYLSPGSFRSREAMFDYLDTHGKGKITTFGDIEAYIKEKSITGAEAEKLRTYWE
ncbi:MAG: hypothetical protein IJW21_02025 [Clostridia bacterium]|nr:hypothetical protein [Clostridia bacterium]